MAEGTATATGGAPTGAPAPAGIPAGADTGAEGTPVVTGSEGEPTGEQDTAPIDFNTFDMLDGEEVSQNALESFLTEKGIEDEGVKAELQSYFDKATELGITTEQFNGLAEMFISSLEQDTQAEQQETAEAEKQRLLDMKAQLTIDEKKAWKPLITQISKEHGEEVAKQIGTDINLFRAFLGKGSEEGAEPKVLTNDKEATGKSKAELRVERAERLKEAYGNDEKTEAIFKEYATKYPKYFKQ